MKKDTKNIILLAAKDVFTQKGFAGARMQEIADKAGINKGLLHYYFKSKNALFNAVFFEIFDAVSPELNDILSSKETDVLTKVSLFVDRYMNLLLQNPFFISHIVCELNRAPNKLISGILRSDKIPNPIPFLVQLQQEAQEGKIKQTDPFQLMISIVSLCAFPFVGRPVMEIILDIQTPDFLQLMTKRKEWIKQFIHDGLRP
ncbi:MAG TPA: TetR/AcrR family transcriptional regulator [Saprospiraceae bacterium]|nr:TetR/AcrR family transcriptional regulator [Saprospiraceae bacterium]